MAFYMFSWTLTCIVTFSTVLTWLNEFFFTLFTIFLATIVTFLMETYCIYGFLNYTYTYHYTYQWLHYPCPSLYLPGGILFLFCLYLLASWTLFWGHCLLQQGSGCQLSWCLWLISCRLHNLCDHCICLLPQTSRGHICVILLGTDLKSLLRTSPN